MWSQDTEDASFFLPWARGLGEDSVSSGGMQFPNGNNDCATVMLTVIKLFHVLSPNAKGCRYIVFNSHKTPLHVHLFIKKYLLNIFYRLDTVLGALDTKIKSSWSLFLEMVP